jgi:hypothetical protein
MVVAAEATGPGRIPLAAGPRLGQEGREVVVHVAPDFTRVVIEDTPEGKDLIVCTQCSFTAWPVRSLPPDWYKSPEHRARLAELVTRESMIGVAWVSPPG